MAFRFREFEVEDDHSTQKVGTDAVLLGAWIQPGNARNILEIGTGCGVIALMAASKTLGRIDAIDSDPSSIKEAESNFLKSPWSERLHAILAGLQDYSVTTEDKYDYILSNPPFFANSLLSTHPGKNRARHMRSLSWNDLFQSVSELILPEGTFALIAPASDYSVLSGAALSNLFFLQRLTEVHSVEDKPPYRILAEFSKELPETVKKDSLVIKMSDGSMSDAFARLTRDYYLPAG